MAKETSKGSKKLWFVSNMITCEMFHVEHSFTLFNFDLLNVPRGTSVSINLNFSNVPRGTFV